MVDSNTTRLVWAGAPTTTKIAAAATKRVTTISMLVALKGDTVMVPAGASRVALCVCDASQNVVRATASARNAQMGLARLHRGNADLNGWVLAESLGEEGQLRLQYVAQRVWIEQRYHGSQPFEEGLARLLARDVGSERRCQAGWKRVLWISGDLETKGRAVVRGRANSEPAGESVSKDECERTPRTESTKHHQAAAELRQASEPAGREGCIVPRRREEGEGRERRVRVEGGWKGGGEEGAEDIRARPRHVPRQQSCGRRQSSESTSESGVGGITPTGGRTGGKYNGKRVLALGRGVPLFPEYPRPLRRQILFPLSRELARLRVSGLWPPFVAREATPRRGVALQHTRKNTCHVLYSLPCAR